MERINLRYWREEEIKRLLPEKFVEREIGSELLQAMESGKVLTIYGPRQSGKTSLIGWVIHRLLTRGVAPKNINYAAMDYLDVHPLVSDTRKFLRLLREESDGKERIYLFIDEVQRLENAGLLLKQIYNARMNLQIVASGSSILGIKEKIKEHLTGRKIDLILYPFSFLEFLTARRGLPEKKIRRYKIDETQELIELYRERLSSHWEEYIRIGGYPEVIVSSERKKWLYSGLFSTYLEKDVGGLLGSGNYQKFQDFVRLIASEVGKTYNRQAVARILGRDARTIEKFEDILNVTFVSYKLAPFYTNIRKELSKSPRFYFIDTGLRNFISGEPEDVKITGTLLENGVISEMLKFAYNKDFLLHWWRSKGGAEVDLVLKKKEVIPFEVKGIRERKPKLTRSFISFIEKYKPKRAYFVTGGYYGNTNHKNTKIYYLPSYLIGLLKEF